MSSAHAALMDGQVPVLSAPRVADGASMPVCTDRYFDGEPGLVAAFDFDYERIMSFEKELRWAQLLSGWIFFPPTWVSCCCCLPCFLNQNVEWQTQARHVALSADGIRYVTEKRKTMCGLPCSDQGKASKTVPYDKVTDCDVQEPAGNACCCCVQNVLSTVHVDTASSGGGRETRQRHELSLAGLKFPTEFKQAVWGMKRSQAGGQAAQPQPGRLGQLAPPQAEMDTALLAEIRDELRRANGLLSVRVKSS